MQLPFLVFGFPVRLGVTGLLYGALVVAYSGLFGAGIVLIAGGSVLIHELGHAFAFRRYGCSAEISLHGFGGSTVSYDAWHLTHREHLAVSLAGPLAQLALLGAPAILISQAGGVTGPIAGLVFVVGAINIVWAILNLLPLYPLDGGHVLYRALAHFGIRSAWRITRGATFAFAALGLFIATQLGFRFAVLLLGYAVWRALRDGEPGGGGGSPIHRAASRARARHRPLSTKGRRGDQAVAEALQQLAAGNGPRVDAILGVLDDDKRRQTDAAAIRLWRSVLTGQAIVVNDGDPLLLAVAGPTPSLEAQTRHIAAVISTHLTAPQLPVAIRVLEAKGRWSAVVAAVADMRQLEAIEDMLMESGLPSAQMAVARELRIRTEAHRAD